METAGVDGVDDSTYILQKQTQYYGERIGLSLTSTCRRRFSTPPVETMQEIIPLKLYDIGDIGNEAINI